MSIEAKKNLRARLKRMRSEADEHELARADRHIAQAVQALPQFEATPLILTYLSFGREVDTRVLIEQAWACGKKVALPRCLQEGTMRWHYVTSYDDLVTSCFGIDEPDPAVHPELDLSQVSSNALAFVPGLAFDQDGYRIGYGGGYYDRFLQAFPGTSVGLCRSATFVDSLQDSGVIDAHDLPVDLVVTDQT